MRHSILLLLLTVCSLRLSAAQLGGEFIDFKITVVSPEKVQLNWIAFQPDDDASVRYSVFRGVSETFTPSPKNRIASGLTKTSYVASGDKDYYYAVEAVIAKRPAVTVRDSKGAKVPATQGTEDTRRTANQSETQCHDLIEQAAIVRLEWDIYAPDLEKALYANQQRISGWMDQLDDCVNNHPQQLSVDDWQKLVSAYARMQREFDADFESQVAITVGQASSTQQNKNLRENDQQWLNDYNDLVHKYNDLVRNYNNQAKLLAMPPPPMHCITFSPVGGIGSIDCF